MILQLLAFEYERIYLILQPGPLRGILQRDAKLFLGPFPLSISYHVFIHYGVKPYALRSLEAKMIRKVKGDTTEHFLHLRDSSSAPTSSFTMKSEKKGQEQECTFENLYTTMQHLLDNYIWSANRKMENL